MSYEIFSDHIPIAVIQQLIRPSFYSVSGHVEFLGDKVTQAFLVSIIILFFHEQQHHIHYSSCHRRCICGTNILIKNG
jgi:hypothetical protein